VPYLHCLSRIDRAVAVDAVQRQGGYILRMELPTDGGEARAVVEVRHVLSPVLVLAYVRTRMRCILR
jgi:hypothetical protein